MEKISRNFIFDKTYNYKELRWVKQDIILEELKKLGIDEYDIYCTDSFSDEFKEGNLFEYCIATDKVIETKDGIKIESINIGELMEDSPFVYKENPISEYLILKY